MKAMNLLFVMNVEKYLLATQNSVSLLAILYPDSLKDVSLQYLLRFTLSSAVKSNF